MITIFLINSRKTIQLIVTFYIDKRGNLSPVVSTTIDDIFRRMDIQLNGSLSAEELNIFGKVIGNKQLANITKAGLNKGVFKNISCNAGGMTRYGLKQYFKNCGVDYIAQVWKTLGYDNSLHSTKAKPFTVTIQTKAKLTAGTGNAITQGMNEKAWDLMAVNYHKIKGWPGLLQNKHCAVFICQYPNSRGWAFAALNKTDKAVTITFDMLKSKGVIFMPSKGKVVEKIPPKGWVYLASAVCDPGAKSQVSYTFSSKQ